MQRLVGSRLVPLLAQVIPFVVSHWRVSIACVSYLPFYITYVFSIRPGSVTLKHSFRSYLVFVVLVIYSLFKLSFIAFHSVNRHCPAFRIAK